MLEDTGANAVDGGLAGVGVANDAAFADVSAAGFELGFDEDHGASLPGLFGCAECAEDGRQDERGGDEGDVHGQKHGRGCGWSEKLAGGEEAGIGAFAEGNARVVAELLGDLAVAGVDGEDGGGSGLEHAVGEASGGGADVDAGESGEGDGPVGEGALEFEAAAADVFEIGAEEADGGGGGDGGTGLVDALLVDEDAAGEDEGLGAFAGGGMAVVDEEFVEACFGGTAQFGGTGVCGAGHVVIHSSRRPVVRLSSHHLGSLEFTFSRRCIYLFMAAWKCGRGYPRAEIDIQDELGAISIFRVKLHWR